MLVMPLAQAANLSPNRTEFDGSRTDVSGELTFSPSDKASFKAFAQGTLDRDDSRSENSRYGIGTDVKVSDRLSLRGEVSGGNGGLGAQAQATFKKDDNTEYYLGYALSTDRSDTGFSTEREGYRNSGVLTAGGRTQLNDNLSLYGEEQYGYGDQGQQLTHTYGLEFRPDEKWTLGASIENGVIDDDINGSFDRTAFSVSAGRISDNLRVASQLEGRFEDGILNGAERDRTTLQTWRGKQVKLSALMLHMMSAQDCLWAVNLVGDKARSLWIAAQMTLSIVRLISAWRAQSTISLRGGKP